MTKNDETGGKNGYKVDGKTKDGCTSIGDVIETQRDTRVYAALSRTQRGQDRRGLRGGSVRAG